MNYAVMLNSADMIESGLNGQYWNNGYDENSDRLDQLIEVEWVRADTEYGIRCALNEEGVESIRMEVHEK